MVDVEYALWADATIGAEVHQSLHNVAHANAFIEESRQGGHETEEDNHHHVHMYDTDHDAALNRFQPHGIILTPIYDSFDRETRQDVGSTFAMFSLDSFLVNLLPKGVNGVYIVLKTNCGQIFTYRVDGSHVRYVLREFFACFFVFLSTILMFSVIFSCRQFILGQGI